MITNESNYEGDSQVEVLFQPFHLKSLTLENRIVMAPMTRGRAPEGVPGENIAAYYRRRAERAVGLILSEGTVIDRPASRNEPGIPLFYGEAALAGWKHVIDQVHAAGGRMGPQLWHTGSLPSAMSAWTPSSPVESPSGLISPGQVAGNAMSDNDVADTIAAFGRAAAETKRLGFDLVEIHGAHGYLIDQFFWAGTNQRTDGYGGASLKERSRFAAEVVKCVRQNVGPDMPISLRVSQWKQQDYSVRLAATPDAMAEWLAPLVEAGADILHCSQRRFWEAEFPDVDGEAGLNFAGWAKKLTEATTIAVGSVGLSGDAIAAFSGETSFPAGLENLTHRMEREEFDLVAVGRPLLADPSWAAKIHQGKSTELQGFTPAALRELI